MRVSQTLLVVAAVCSLLEAVRAEEDHLRRTLEKEILKHTINYLRAKLVRCLSQSPGSRTKRKVEDHVDQMTMYQVDMDILQNTRDFLYTRTLQCMKTQKGEGHVHRKFHPTKGNSKVKARDLFRPTPEPLPVTTQAMPVVLHQVFTLEGRTINCESVTTRPDGSLLLCRNLMIDGKMRLPNWSLCPPRYYPDAWWQLNSIQSATFRVLDVEGLCQSLGVVAGIKGKVADVKVAWDCDQTTARLKWLNGKWAGEVNDNGFLRDLKCEYTPTTT